MKLIVVIPCYNEPDLLKSLQSLYDCEVKFPVEVITVINASEKNEQLVKDHNQRCYQEAVAWAEQVGGSYLTFHFILENDLPSKHAGVGLARKIGMDEAVRMFDSIGNDDGIILCYDADCTCKPDLLSEVYGHFKQYPKSPACSIHFEHPLEGDKDSRIYDGILNYELHLRYYVDALKFSGFPYAHQTIGSSMAVRSSAYQKQGGMNRRKAGEDFYFLHKLMPLGGFSEVNSTMIIPSPRKSNRVPFGTGRAIGEWLDDEQEEYLTYTPDCFLDLKVLFDKIQGWRNLIEEHELKYQFSLLPTSVQNFITEEVFVKKMKEINRQSTTLATYKKRFFQWWDGFKVLKFIHFCRDHFYPNVSIEKAIDWLFEEIGLVTNDNSLKSKLIELREFDRT